MICHCGNEIPQERLDLGFKVCVICGERIANKNRPKGYISYGHKTAGAIVVTTQKGFDNYQRVAYRHSKGSNMASASKVGTSF